MSQTLSTPPQSDESVSRSAVWMTILLIAGSFAAATMAGAFTGEKTRFLYKEVLHLSASDVATLMIITGIPGYLRPFMGAGSDLFPIFGFHRRSYFVLSWLVSAASYLWLGSIHQYSYITTVAVVTAAAAGGNLMAVIVDAVMVSVGTASGTVGRMQAVQQGVQMLLGVLVASRLAGFVTQHWSYSHCYRAGALVCLLAIPLVAFLPEKRVIKEQQPNETEEV